MDWVDFLTVANDLNVLAKKKPEHENALYRSSISRSYYAVYNSTVDWCRKNKTNLLGKEHYELFDALKKSNISRNIACVAVIGNDLRQKRNAADYDGVFKREYGRLHQQSKICHREAKKALNFLNGDD